MLGIWKFAAELRELLSQASNDPTVIKILTRVVNYHEKMYWEGKVPQTILVYIFTLTDCDGSALFCIFLVYRNKYLKTTSNHIPIRSQAAPKCGPSPASVSQLSLLHTPPRLAYQLAIQGSFHARKTELS